ncbi:MAG: class I SAM-dependent methyltransferase [Prolixibacteraceae bacterium]
MKSKIVEIIFRIWYWYVNKIDKNADVKLMNYGFSDKNQVVPMNEQDESDRYSIQLYHHLASSVELKNKDIVEIGSGRGGGLMYVTKNFSPASAKGVDLCKKAISFCKKHYKHDKLTFEHGNAQELTLEDNSYDVVLNVESSHRYPDFESFIAEVHRILRPEGYFLFTDLRLNTNFDEMKRVLEASGLTIHKERFINEEVVAALELDDLRRRNLVERLTPKILHKQALRFAGNKGSSTYDRFKSKEFIYFSYVIKKELKKTA